MTDPPCLPRVARIAAPLVAHAVLVLAVGLAIVAGTARPASAHAAFVASSPAPGSDLAAAPGVVTVQFSEPLIEDLSQLTVTDPNGQAFTGGATGEREMQVDLATTAQGRYAVEWKTVSPVDGHTLHGGFEFGVGAATDEQDAPSGLPSATDLLIGVARTVEYVGLLGALGLLSLAALVTDQQRWVPRGLHRWVALGAAGGLLTVAGEVLLASSGSVGSAAGTFLLAPPGWPRLGRLVTELAAAAITLAAARRSGDGAVPGRRARVAATLLTLASLGFLAAAGHAAAAGGYGILADAGHLAAAGVWAGALLVMAVQRPPGGWRGQVGRALIGELSPVALTMFVATVLLGSVRGWQELAHLRDLWSTAYGQVLAAKILIVVAMVPLSLLAWRRRRPLSRVEGLLALGAVLAAAVLAAFPVPPGRADEQSPDDSGAAQEALPQPGDLTLAGEAGTTVVGLTLRPAEPGINDLYVHLLPARGERHGEAMAVSMALEGGDPIEMRRCGIACRVVTVPLTGGEEVAIEVAAPQPDAAGDQDGAAGEQAAAGGTAALRLPALPAPDGTQLAQRLTERMQQLERLRYDEVFGPQQPPIRSEWEIVAPDRIHGRILGGADFLEIIRIGDRAWRRTEPGGPWRGDEPGGPVVKANRFIWDYPDKVAARVVGTAAIDGVDTTVVSFYVDVHGLPVWYLLWVDDDDRVRRAEMRTQGHLMDHRYHDFDAAITIQPPDR